MRWSLCHAKSAPCWDALNFWCVLLGLSFPLERPGGGVLTHLSSATVARYRPSGEKQTDRRELVWTSLL